MGENGGRKGGRQGFDGLCVVTKAWSEEEGGLRQQRNDGGGCATMRERSERVESPGSYVTE